MIADCNKLPRELVQSYLALGHPLVRCKTIGNGNVTTWSINGKEVHHKTVESFIKAKLISMVDVGCKYQNCTTAKYAEFKLKES